MTLSNKLQTSIWYEAKSMDDHHGIGFKCESMEQLKQSINVEEQHTTEQGYPANKWQIVRGKSNKVFNRYGEFMYESIKREAVAVYDGGKITLYGEGA